MFEWPLEAKYDREIPQERIYEHGRVNADLRGRFDCEIARITWAYKLASVTINLADTPQAPEVQVVEVRVRGRTFRFLSWRRLTGPSRPRWSSRSLAACGGRTKYG